MFTLAILFGLFSYTIFLLGLLKLLYIPVIIFVTVCFVAIFVLRFKSDIVSTLKKAKSKRLKEKTVILLVALLSLQAIVNLFGVLAPELSFDALWYHLTLPKLYLQNHAVFYIPGGLLYYSAMPKLGELIYVAALAIGTETAAKFLHFLFGLFTCIAIYKMTTMASNRKVALLAVVIFYSNLVVAWESTTAYIDLLRTFYELLALWGFVLWYKVKDQKWFVLSAVMIGFAITTKVLAIGSLLIFCSLISWKFIADKKINLSFVKHILVYTAIALMIPLPWFIFSFLHTGNPVYPFFSNIYSITPEPFSVIQMVKDIFAILLFAPDPISPVYLISIPLVIMLFAKLKIEIKLLVFYSLLSLIVWYFTPRTGGGRFLLPYLPAFSILCAAVLYELHQRTKYKVLYKFSLSIIILVAIISIGYRLVASAKYVSVVTGQETKQEFLANNLNFTFGDYYDTDNYFSQHITSTDKVLLYGFHNLYYVEFPFIDSSWVKKGDTFNFIAVQNGELPSRFQDWQIIYTNAKTMVKLYRPPKAICKQLCIY